MNLKAPHFAYRLPPCVFSASLAVCLAASLAAQTAGTPHVPVLPATLANFPSSLLLPPTGTLDCAQDISFAGPAGLPPVQLSGLRLSPPAVLQAPPAAGTTVVQSYGTSARAMVCLDGSSSFQPVAMSAAVQVQVSAVTDSDGSLRYDTEMLQLNLSGGSLPTGMLLRESPTLQSTGTTKIRKIDSSNAYRIDSFFDVFLELSMDGGQSWRAAMAVAQCGLSAPSVETACAAAMLPPSGSVHRCATAMEFANGAVVRNLALRNPTSSLPPPPPGGALTVSTSVSVTGELSLDGGSSFQPFESAATCSEEVTSLFDDGAVRYFDTEMLSLNLSGGSLPGGVMIRESPTKQSLGRSSLRQAPDNQYRISSFFDIFTEISLDGGQDWSPCSNGACNCAILRESPSHFFTNAGFPMPADYACDSDASVSFGSSGVVISDLSFRPADVRAPLPAPGTSETVTLGGTVTGTLAKDGKIIYFPYTLTNNGNTSDTFVVSSNSSGESPMECLSFDFTTGGPSPVMIRESPTKASLGRTSVRTVPGGYMISSFFDVFLELSTDGGLNWTPADSTLHLALRPYVEQENILANAYLPPRDGSFGMLPLDSPIDCPNGVLVRNLRLDSFASSQPLPFYGVLAQAQTIACNASCEISSDYGSTWTAYTCPASTSMQVTPLPPPDGSFGDWTAKRVYDTELLACDLSGGTLPTGMMIRESPTKQSLGRCTTQRLPGATACRMDSFFDVFTEVSLDGGQTWSPAADAVRLQLRALHAACFCRTDWVPVALDYRAPDSQFFCSAGQTGIRAFALASQAQSTSPPGGILIHPDYGTPTDLLFSAPVAFDLTLDGGATISSVACDASVTLHSSASSDSSGSSITQECTQLDLSGGTLPSGVMLRESPTLHSTGQTTVRVTDGGYRISSFFDIFTEVSLDSGLTWTPLCSPIHLEACESPPDMLSASATQVQLDRFTVPPGGLLPQCSSSVSLNFTKIMVDYKEQKRTSAPPVVLPSPGNTTTVIDNGTVDFLYSADGGVSYTPVHCDSFCRYDLKPGNGGFTGESVYDITIRQFEFSGGNLPSGVMIRESPTLPSRGQTRIHESPTLPSRPSSYRVSSFFDVFTEISLDSGMTWQAFDGPLHLQCDAPPAASLAADNSWPLPGQFELWPNNGDLDFTTPFANGASMSFFDIFPELSTFRPPLPTPTNPPVVIPSNGRCHFHLVPADGTPVDVDCDAACSVSFTATGTYSDGTSNFDTEMLNLDLSGGTLPSGMMLRESPSKATLGKHTVRASADGGGGGAGGFSVSSFFDVFLELSTDSGKTWSPAAAPVHLEFTAPQISVVDQDNTVLVSGSSVLALSPSLTGSSVTRVLTVQNNGTADLTGFGVSFTGPDAGDFSVAQAPPSLVPARSAIQFTVVYSSASPGQKGATMHLACPTAAVTSFDVALSARSLAPDAVDNADGIPNKDELALAAYGFNPLADNSAALQTLRDSGFYRSSDMQALALGRPVLQRDASSGHFHLQVGIRESPTLQSWSALTKFSATCDPATGLFDIDIAPETTSAQFYQVFGGPP